MFEERKVNQNDVNKKHGPSWHCRPEVCNLTEEQIANTAHILRMVSEAHNSGTRDVYSTDIIKSCTNPVRAHRHVSCYPNTVDESTVPEESAEVAEHVLQPRLGHSITCTRNNCEGHEFSFMVAVSSHFPTLRTLVRRMYEIRHIELSIKAVRLAKSEGSLTDLQFATTKLHMHYSQKVATMVPKK